MRVDLEAGLVLTRGRPGFLTNGAALSPDGRLVAVIGSGGEVGLMDARTGDHVRPPELGHDDRGGSVSWAPDSSAYVTTALGGTVALWDGQTGELLGSVQLPERRSASAQFAADGTTVVIGTYTDALYEWDTTTEHAIDFACALVGRDFTEAEWRRWFGERPYQPTCRAIGPSSRRPPANPESVIRPASPGSAAPPTRRSLRGYPLSLGPPGEIF